VNDRRKIPKAPLDAPPADKVTTTDIAASSGVIHVIGSVVVPKPGRSQAEVVPA